MTTITSIVNGDTSIIVKKTEKTPGWEKKKDASRQIHNTENNSEQKRMKKIIIIKDESRNIDDKKTEKKIVKYE